MLTFAHSRMAIEATRSLSLAKTIHASQAVDDFGLGDRMAGLSPAGALGLCSDGAQDFAVRSDPCAARLAGLRDAPLDLA